MRRLWIVGLAALASCSGAPAEPENQLAAALANAAPEPAPSPVPASTAAAGSLEAWLVGTWSFEAKCETDLLVRYEAGGALDNSGESGHWALEGDQVTETVTERFHLGDDAPQKLDPPETRSYTVARADQGHGTITFEGRKVPILRC